MADSSSEVASALLDHSERIRLLTIEVERQRKTISKTGRLLAGSIVIAALIAWPRLGIWPYNSAQMLRGDSLFLEAKGMRSVALVPSEHGLAVMILQHDKSPGTGFVLNADGEALSVVKSGEVIWESQ